MKPAHEDEILHDCSHEMQSRGRRGQLAYLGNRETRSVAPFFLSNLEKAYVPASKESFAPSPAKNKLPTDWDENRVVVWLKKKKRLSPSSEIVVSQKDMLPEGAKLIRLKPESDKAKTTKCIYWWEGDYHTGDFLEDSLGNDNNVPSNYVEKVVKNDIEHLLKRIEEYLEEDDPDFSQVVAKIKKFNSKEYSSKDIYEWNNALNTKLKINHSDLPSTLKIFIETLTALFDANGKYSKLIKETLFVPLTKAWFDSDPLLIDKYKSFWESWGLFTGSVGEGREIYEFKDELFKLQEIVSNKGQNKVNSKTADSAEAKWLLTLTMDTFNKVKRLIFLSDGAWGLNTISDEYALDKYHSYADHVAIEHTLGPFRIPPILSVIIHEMVSNSRDFMRFVGQIEQGGGHIEPHFTRVVWEGASQGDETYKYNQDLTDHLYQSQRGHATIALGVILNEIAPETE